VFGQHNHNPAAVVFSLLPSLRWPMFYIYLNQIQSPILAVFL